MKKNKALGLDALLVEFYLTFWTQVGKDLVEVYREIMEREHVEEDFALQG